MLTYVVVLPQATGDEDSIPDDNARRVIKERTIIIWVPVAKTNSANQLRDAIQPSRSDRLTSSEQDCTYSYSRNAASKQQDHWKIAGRLQAQAKSIE